ncbi:hypothetical protein CPB83DRAFT_411331 [Crepidotus variabilis]|uniref:Myb-like domain-containing protein n=1 Tax=Crepidotus variabilis TaxID=179855 RepID=A0A9P6ES37_9AGAR|nr:hypothetical protein CPB83DRAFT_411331 [Crepidotus variabilis]
MDNPQHYQPLSHALNPPPPSSVRTHYTPVGHHAGYVQHPPQQMHPHAHEDEEEEEEEEEEDDEDMVEDHLNQHDSDMHGSGQSSPKAPSSGNQQVSAGTTSQTPVSPEKRRPGRPRGSKNRKPRASAKHETQFYAGQQTASAGLPAPPSNPNLMPHNQQYYEFQWRMLNLCAEFYGAAEELVKATTPLVIAQSYQLGPGIKVDPLTMLAEAKRVCDTLLANPSQLFSNPPASVYPVLPTPVYQPLSQAPVPAVPTHPIPVPLPPPAPAATSSASSAGPSPPSSVPPPAIITGAQSFVVPLGQPPYPGYPVYSTAPQYPTTPYYHQYGYGTPYYAQHPPPGVMPMGTSIQPQPVASTSTTPAASSSTTTPTSTATSAASTVTMTTKPTTATITTTPATGGTMIGNSGQWSEEESDRLRKLSEDSKRRVSSGEADWDWIVSEWGPTRTRHQILLQANKLNLKESTTRGTKRRRGDDGGHTSSTPVMSSLQPSTSTASSVGPPTSATPSATPTVPNSTTTTAHATPVPMSMQIASPAQSTSHSTSTPGASPALQNLPRPSSSKGMVVTPASTTTPKLPWPMPTVAAVNTASGLPAAPTSSSPATLHAHPHSSQIAAAAAHDARASYYRPRPSIPSTPSLDSTKTHQQQQLQQPHLQQQQQQQQQHQAHYGHHTPTQHHMTHNPHQYMYTPNGQMASYRPKENGK